MNGFQCPTCRTLTSKEIFTALAYDKMILFFIKEKYYVVRFAGQSMYSNSRPVATDYFSSLQVMFHVWRRGVAFPRFQYSVTLIVAQILSPVKNMYYTPLHICYC